MARKRGEAWHFGIEKGEGPLVRFLSTYDLALLDLLDAPALEERYFRDAAGRTVGRVNGAHCLVRAVKR